MPSMMGSYFPYTAKGMSNIEDLAVRLNVNPEWRGCSRPLLTPLSRKGGAGFHGYAALFGAGRLCLRIV